MGRRVSTPEWTTHGFVSDAEMDRRIARLSGRGDAHLRLDVAAKLTEPTGAAYPCQRCLRCGPAHLMARWSHSHRVYPECLACRARGGPERPQDRLPPAPPHVALLRELLVEDARDGLPFDVVWSEAVRIASAGSETRQEQLEATRDCWRRVFRVLGEPAGDKLAA